MRCISTTVTALALVAGLSIPAAAQTGVTQSDIQRLQDAVFDASSDVSRLRGRDVVRATQLQTELDELRDEVIYLKVKLRKRESLTRNEYSSVRDRIDDLRTRTRDEGGFASNAGSGAAPRNSGNARPRTTTAASTSRDGLEIPTGTELDVRLLNSLNSDTAQVEDRFEGTTLVDLTIDGRVAVPAGSVMRGVVSGVEPATRTNRTGKMTVSFDQVTVQGRSYPIRATVTEAIESDGIKGEAGRIGAGAGVGAIIGGILGGFKGALAGILIGGGGTIAATEGKDVKLDQGTVLRVRFDSPVTIGR